MRSFIPLKDNYAEIRQPIGSLWAVVDMDSSAFITARTRSWARELVKCAPNPSRLKVIKVALVPMGGR